MTYRISGLDPAAFVHLVNLPDADLAAQGVVRLTVDQTPGFPCRVSLDDATPGETMLLVNHVSHDGSGPYRASHAIFVTEGVERAACFTDTIPPALNRRILSLRGFGKDGLMIDATLVQPGEADAVVRAMLAEPAIDHIDAHNAARGCFAARIERDQILRV